MSHAGLPGQPVAAFFRMPRTNSRSCETFNKTRCSQGFFELRKVATFHPLVTAITRIFFLCLTLALLSDNYPTLLISLTALRRQII
jgi:hypothetical protein